MDVASPAQKSTVVRQVADGQWPVLRHVISILIIGIVSAVARASLCANESCDQMKR